MTLSDWADVARIVTSIGTMLVLGISAFIAYRIYMWQRSAARSVTLTQFSDQMRAFNLHVLADEEMQDLEAEHHPWGKLERSQIKRMYRYFVLLNIAQALHTAKNNDTVEDDRYEAHMSNFANMMFDDREFVQRHCFPRGYPQSFREEFQERWKLRLEKGL